MSILGKAIGRHLQANTGRMYVELPAGMDDAAAAVADTVNAAHPGGAVLVTRDPGAGPYSAEPGQALAWRTDHDRIFVWSGTDFDPDTGFKSAVEPFLSRTFPEGCRCDLALLAELGADALLEGSGQPVSTPIRQAFYASAAAALAFLEGALSEAPATPSEPGVLAVLRHWDAALDVVSADIAALGRALRPSDALQVFHRLGLPAPEQAYNGSILSGERPFPDPAAARKDGQAWAEFCREALGDRPAREQFQARLDAEGGPAGGGAWAGLAWGGETAGATPFEAVRRTLAAADGPMSTPGLADRAGAGPSAWFGASADDARRIAGKTAAWEWSPAPGSQVSAGANGSVIVLETGRAQVQAVARGHHFVLDDVAFALAAGARAHVHESPPATADDGDRWIDPRTLELKAQRLLVRNVGLSVEGGALMLRATVRVPIPAAGGKPPGWSPLSNLTASFKAAEWRNGVWLPPVPVRLAARLLVPSPYSPTALVTQGQNNRPVQAYPPAEAGFVFEDGTWGPSETRDLQLPSKGVARCLLYRAVMPTEAPATPVALGEVAVSTVVLRDGDFGPVEGDVSLEDGDPVTWAGGDLGVFRAPEGEADAPSALLRAVRRQLGGRVEVLEEAAKEARGAYEARLAEHVGRVLAGSEAVSLGILAVSARGSAPDPSVPAFGVGRLEAWTGVSEVLPLDAEHVRAVEALPAFPAFQSAAVALAAAMAGRGAGRRLVSTWGYEDVSLEMVQAYSSAHAALVAEAAALDPWARLVARFPFSVLVFQRRQEGGTALRMAAALLSPMHPARLAWAWGVAHAAASTSDAELPAELLGLAEGWNIPCSSGFPTAAGDDGLAVAQPLEQGAGATFAAWSGLVAVVEHQSAPPPEAFGLPLPWAGQAGVTEGALRRALEDFKAVHPFGETLSVALDALQPVPRSSGIDDAVVNLLGGADRGFPGGVEVWDSQTRQGSPPRRQQLLKRRSEGADYPAFTWRRVAEEDLPPRVDFRVFEAIETTTAHEASARLGRLGGWPLRRFAGTAFDPSTGWLVRDHALEPAAGDELGLFAVLEAVEHTYASEATAVRIQMPTNLGRDNKASRWTVLGDLNLHPSVLAEYAGRHVGQLLWEWRTGWLGMGQKPVPGERSYYVTSEVPASFRRGLAARQALSEAQVDVLLKDLGRRGIGLASMFNGGRPQERGAMGFFYAFRLLFPPGGAAAPAAWLKPGEVHAVVPVDAVNRILEAIAGPGHNVPAKDRADFVLLVLRKGDGGRLGVTAIPIEVKHRGAPHAPAALSPADARHARDQVANTRALLHAVGAALADTAAPPVALHARRNALALLLELGLGMSARPQQAAEVADLLGRALHGGLDFHVAAGAVLAFMPGAFTTQLFGVSAYSVGRQDGILQLSMDPKALPGFFWDGEAAPPPDARDQLDAALLQLAEGAVAAGEAQPPPRGAVHAPTRPAPAPASPQGGEVLAAPDGAGTTPSPTTPAPPEALEAPQPPAPAATGPGGPAAEGPSTAAGTEAAPVPQEPEAVIGAPDIPRRWATIGRNERGQAVALDLEAVHAMGVFGFMGSGKSYFLNTLIEGAAAPIPGLNSLPQPLAVVVFNYRQSAHDRFEYGSLAYPNDSPSDAAALAGYGVQPKGLPDLQVLALPNQLSEARKAEYGPASASELAFNPATLSLEDWMLLMGEPGHQKVYAQTITAVLRDMERQRVPVTLQGIEDALQADEIPPVSRKAGELRLKFLREYVSETAPTDFASAIRPGAVTVIDLRASLFNKHDALRFFLVCANQIGQLRGFNKLVVFDEAHEYMSAEFEDKISSRIRNLRHEGASYVFATQDVESLPEGILKFLDTAFVFGMGTARNQADLASAIAPMKELGDRVLRIERGECYVWSQSSKGGLFSTPRKVLVRPRVTRHGGATQTFLG